MSAAGNGDHRIMPRENCTHLSYLLSLTATEASVTPSIRPMLAVKLKLLCSPNGWRYNIHCFRCLVTLVTGLILFMTLLKLGTKQGSLSYGVKIPLQIFRMHSSEILVISLPNRQDRRRDMERLRVELGLQWSYVDALSSDSPLVALIMARIVETRDTLSFSVADNAVTNFSWPDNLENSVNSFEEISMWTDGYNPWDLLATGFPHSTSYQRIVCAIKNCTIPTGFLPEYMILTPSRIACWHSHLAVIHKLANSLGPHGHGVALVLEDDVDMEEDIDQQTYALWRTLPPDWDIVFLGHCWSDERRGALVASLTPSGTEYPEAPHFHLHVSTSPKCTHAYALSRTGARRLLLHLRHPPFAYSRAIDQALAWLVESGRLKSFSVVPSLVVQRKVSKSDVMAGNSTGSKWKDTLRKGVFLT